MAIICRDHKLLFIMVPGTGCSAIGGVLRRDLGGEFLPDEPVSNGASVLLGKKHNTIDQLLKYKVLSKEELNELLVFAAVRNPFDRFATEYQRLLGDWYDRAFDSKWFDGTSEDVKKKVIRRINARRFLFRRIGFNNWMKAKLLKWEIQRWLKPGKNKDRHLHLVYPMINGVEVLIRFEHLEDDLKGVLQRAGIESPLSLRHGNKTPGKRPFQEYYSRSTRWMMEKVLEKELERFGYKFEG